MRYYLLIVFQLICSIISAQTKWSDFDDPIQYTEKNGLSSQQLYTTNEDRDGFLWLTTPNSISRFDGSTFINYQKYTKQGIEYEIKDAYEIEFDYKRNQLFVVTHNGVLISTIGDIKLRHVSDVYTSLPFDVGSSYTIYIADDYLWIGTSGDGLLMIDLVGNNHQQFLFKNVDLSKQDLIWLNEVNKIVPDNINNNIIWLPTAQGLIEFNIATKEYQIHYFNGNKDLFENNIWNVVPTQDVVYCSTPNNNWFIFSRSDGSTVKPIEQSSPLYFLTIHSLYLDKDDQLWITSPAGIVQFDTKSKTVVNGASNDTKNGKLRGVKLIDSRGITWFSSQLGLFKYSPDKALKFLNFGNKSDHESPFNTLAIIKKNKFIYVVAHSGGNGIYKINPEDYSVQVIPIPVLQSNPNFGYAIRDMISMDQENLLLLGAKKAFVFNTKSETFSEPAIQIPDSSQIYVGNVAKDKNNNYWVATNLDGLYKFNYDELTFKKFKDEFKGKNPRDHQNIKKLYVDDNNKLWIGQAATSVMDLENMNLTWLNPEFNYEYEYDFGEFLEDNDKIWVANRFDGISYADKVNYSKGLTKVLDGNFIGVYKYNDSLLFGVEHSFSRTGNNTLTILNTKTNDHRKVKLDIETSLTGPIINLDDNNFMIGCKEGVIIYNPEKHEGLQELPKTYIQEVKANNELWYSGADFGKVNFSLPSGTKSLSIKISALAFHDPKQISYQYKMDGSWIDLGTGKEINLSNLSQGDYNLELKAINGLGNGLEPVKYSFKIRPFWYTSNLAMVFYILLFGSIVFVLYKFNLNRKLAMAESKRVKELDELKSKMFANISHEFRTPLTIIKGLSDQLLKKSDTVQKDYIKGIGQSNEQLLNLVNQMLDLAALDANKMEVQYKNGDVVAFIQKCVNLYNSYSDSKLQHLEFKTSDTELFMDFDDDKLQKILNNLLSNAIKFTPEGGKIKVTLNQFENKLRIKVSDTGQGISKEELPQVFDRYFTTGTIKESRGTGIGLSLSKELANLLGGTISVKSELGKGTTFSVELPITNEANQTEVNHSLPFVEKSVLPPINGVEVKPRTDHKTILLVEDNPDIQKFVNLLLSADYNIVTANNGYEGLEMAKDNQIDFIISDVMMPQMDGFEFCTRIKSEVATSHIPFIMLSARTDSKDKERAYQLGVDAYLTKPFNQEELRLIIANLIQKQRKIREPLLQLLAIRKPNKNALEINQLDLDLINKLQTLILCSQFKLSANAIAKELFISRTQLHIKIKSLTGKSLTQYANHIRLEKAKHLLETTDLQIKEIAYSLGFESSTYFIRLFKKETGLTPESFRV